MTHVERIRNLSDLAVIDLDTGTVLGTNLVVVPASLVTDDILSSDSAAHDLGTSSGVDLFVFTEDLPQE